MAVEHKAGDSSGEDGSWEKLAEDLLGIDFGKSSANADVPEIDSLLTSETKPAKDPEASADDGASPEPSPFDSDEPGAQTATDASDESIADEPDDAAEDDSAAKPDKTADTFWDPLNEWDWDEGRESAPKTREPAVPNASSPARQETVEPTPTLSPRYEDSAVSESAADLRDEYIADSDFGFGLMDDEDDITAGEAAADGPETIEQPAAIEQPADVESRSPESTPVDAAEQAEVPETKRRRRRRGRRGRGRRPEETENASEKPEQGDSGLPEQTVAEPQMEEAPESDVEGAPADDSHDKPRTGRRRSSRRRRRPSNDSRTAGQEAPAASELVTTESVTVESDDNSPDREEPAEMPALADDGESGSRKIPTWEEAISYLKHNPSPESRSRNSGGPAGGRSSGRRRKS